MIPILPLLFIASVFGALALSTRKSTGGKLVDSRGTFSSGDQLSAEEGLRGLPPMERMGLPNITPRLVPEEERLLALLVLFARDKRFKAGEKRYLTADLALEALRLAQKFNLPKTAMAIRKDGPVPNDEYLRGRPQDIRQLVLSYGSKGRV